MYACGFRPQFPERFPKIQFPGLLRIFPAKARITESGHIQVHKNKVPDASAHDEQVENFMGAKKFMFFIKKGKF